MYKRIKKDKYSLAFNIFPKTAKEVSQVYTTGFRYWDAMDSKNYSVVIGTFRLIFSITKNQLGCTSLSPKESE